MLISSHQPTNDSLPELQVKFLAFGPLGLPSVDAGSSATCSYKSPRKVPAAGFGPQLLLRKLVFDHCAASFSLLTVLNSKCITELRLSSGHLYAPMTTSLPEVQIQGRGIYLRGWALTDGAAVATCSHIFP